jgi:hypothetical protein|nr:MAG TPA: hypothetical protein [Caudoviricetes sp.]
MVSNLEFLRGELTKVQKSLGNTKAMDYKRYATLYQTYVGLVNAVNQTEALQKQAIEEEKRKQEEQKILKEANLEAKAQEKSK